MKLNHSQRAFKLSTQAPYAYEIGTIRTLHSLR